MIDVSELHRVYPVTPVDGKQMESGFQSSCHDSDRSEVMELRSMLEFERMKTNILEKRVRELEEDRDVWRKHSEQYFRLLGDYTHKQANESPEKQRKGLLSRLFELPSKILGG